MKGALSAIIILTVNSTVVYGSENASVLLSVPENCHALMRNNNKAVDVNVLEYMPEIDRTPIYDIFCMSDDIEFNEPVYTNGGNLIIWGSNIRINSPLDTRVYLNHTSIDYYENSSTAFPADEAMSVRRRGVSEKYIRSFNEYYLACGDCRRFSDSTWMPRAPSGLVPASADSSANRDGIKPNDRYINFDALRSGNIYIYASTIDISSSMSSPSPPSNLPECLSEKNIKYIPFALNAQGIYGGNGGAGGPSGCANEKTFGYFGCKPHLYLNSGKSSAGGRGGDAGTVNLIKINGKWGEDEINLFKAVTTVAGGSPGEHVNYISPTARGEFSATGSYCDFRKRPAGVGEKSPAGEYGSFGVRSATSGEAFSEVAELISLNDARFDYDFDELYSRASIYTNIASMTYNDFFARQLDKSIRRADIKVVHAVRDVLINGVAPVGELVSPHLNWSADLELDKVRLSLAAKKFARRLSDFSTGERLDGALYGYLLNSGGLLYQRDPKPAETLYLLTQAIDMAAQALALQKLEISLSSIGNTLAEIDIRFEKNERISDIEKIRLKIAGLRELAASKNGLNAVSKIGEAIGDVGAAALKVYASYQSGMAPAVASSVGHLASAMEQLRAVTMANEEVISDKELVFRLQAMQEHYANFMMKVLTLRREHESAKGQDLRALLILRLQISQRTREIEFIFNDLLASAYQTYLINPTEVEKARFENNLDSLEILLSERPADSQVFSFWKGHQECGRKPIGAWLFGISWRCHTITERGISQVVVHSRKLASGESYRIPIYVVAPRYHGEVMTYKLPVVVEPYYK
jgi:hypothetical protein